MRALALEGVHIAGKRHSRGTFIEKTDVEKLASNMRKLSDDADAARSDATKATSRAEEAVLTIQSWQGEREKLRSLLGVEDSDLVGAVKDLVTKREQRSQQREMRSPSQSFGHSKSASVTLFAASVFTGVVSASDRPETPKVMGSHPARNCRALSDRSTPGKVTHTPPRLGPGAPASQQEQRADLAQPRLPPSRLPSVQWRSRPEHRSRSYGHRSQSAMSGRTNSADSVSVSTDRSRERWSADEALQSARRDRGNVAGSDCGDDECPLNSTGPGLDAATAHWAPRVVRGPNRLVGNSDCGASVEWLGMPAWPTLEPRIQDADALRSTNGRTGDPRQLASDSSLIVPVSVGWPVGSPQIFRNGHTVRDPPTATQRTVKKGAPTGSTPITFGSRREKALCSSRHSVGRPQGLRTSRSENTSGVATPSSGTCSSVPTPVAGTPPKRRHCGRAAICSAKNPRGGQATSELVSRLRGQDIEQQPARESMPDLSVPSQPSARHPAGFPSPHLQVPRRMPASWDGRGRHLFQRKRFLREGDEFLSDSPSTSPARQQCSFASLPPALPTPTTTTVAHNEFVRETRPQGGLFSPDGSLRPSSVSLPVRTQTTVAASPQMSRPSSMRSLPLRHVGGAAVRTPSPRLTRSTSPCFSPPNSATPSSTSPAHSRSPVPNSSTGYPLQARSLQAASLPSRRSIPTFLVLPGDPQVIATVARSMQQLPPHVRRKASGWPPVGGSPRRG